MNNIFRWRSMFDSITRLVVPLSSNEDVRRQERILNVIVLSSAFLSLFAFFRIVIRTFQYGTDYHGQSLVSSILISAVFLSIYTLSRKRFVDMASFLLIFVYLLPTVYALYLWGADVPQALLACALVIVISGILLGTTFAFIGTVAISAIVIVFTYMQSHAMYVPEVYWKQGSAEVSDAVVASFTFLVIAVVSWLSNREMEAALKRARQSEVDLKKERDSLEIRVEERTAELKKTQMEKMLQLYQFSEFGRLSAGLIHDLINPLTALSLNLDQVSSEVGSKSSEKVKSYIEQASLATKRMESYVQIARKQLQHQDVSATFHPVDEIRQVVRMLEYKANAAHVEVRVIGSDDMTMFGNFIRFSQVVANIAANAIDAYEGVDDVQGKRRVDIRMKEQGNGDIIVSVQDWGAGIQESDLASIFEPFFTTKGYENGTGVGLFIVKQIVERDFHGTVSIKSDLAFGTTCIIIFPKNHEESIEENA